MSKMFGSVVLARESSSQESMGAGGFAAKPVGLKLEVSPDILPRDTTIGSKIFTLIPSDARNVREVKTYLAFVLKTPAPFHLFVGEYRIRDEEDVRIFSVINEPCRLLPVPKPRPALSSTPKLKMSNNSSGGSNSSGKRVTFFDGDLSASPVERCEGMVGSNGMSVDQLDHPYPLSFGQAIQDSNSRQCLVTPIQQQTPSNGEGNAIVKMYPDRKRRRRHRSKKSKSGSGSHHKQESDEDNVKSAGSADDTAEANGSYTSEGNDAGSSSSSVRKENLDVLNEETESEEEMANSKNGAKDNDAQFDFITPSAVVKAVKRASKTDTPQLKRQKFSDSAFSSPGSFLSPSPVSSEDSISSGKVRQDTPIPRVIRNPKFFDTARKIVNEFSNGDRNVSNEKILDEGSGDNLMMDSNNATVKSEIGQHSQMVLENDGYYLLDSIKSLEEMNLHDKIAFRVLELDERYNPCVSDFKEGIITGKVGNELTIEYTKNDAVMRNGKYEFQFDEADGDNPATDANTVILKFPEMLEPKLIHHSQQQG